MVVDLHRAQEDKQMSDKANRFYAPSNLDYLHTTRAKENRFSTHSHTKRLGTLEHGKIAVLHPRL